MLSLTDWKYYLDGEFFAYCKSPIFIGHMPVVSFDVKEELGNSYEIEAVIILDRLLRKEDLGALFCVGLGGAEAPFRVYVGNLWQFRYEDASQEAAGEYSYTQNQHIYRIWVYHSLATLGSDIRFHIWEKQTKRQIINELLKINTIRNRSHLIDDGIVLDTNTQYNESSLDYLIRLIQEIGLVAHFDTQRCISKDVEESSIRYHFDMPDYLLYENPAHAEKVRLDFQGVYFGDSLFEQIINFTLENNTTAKKIHLYAYDMLKPSESIVVDDISHTWHNTTEDMYEPSIFTKLDAKKYADTARRRKNTRSVKFKARTTSFKAAVGKKLFIYGASNPDINGEYFIEKSHETLEKTKNGWEYFNDIEGVAYSKDYVPEITKIKPSVNSNQLAIVVGEKDDKRVRVDKKGRVRVKFIWSDDLNRSTDFSEISNPSAWARVMQWGASGDGWGNVSFPHVGQEVVVGFLNGDPDCPIVLGSVHNDEQSFPYNLPDNDRKTVIRAKSVDDLGRDRIDLRYNEFSMDNRMFIEQVYLKAQHEFKYDIHGPVNGKIHGDVVRRMHGNNWFSTFWGSRWEVFGWSLDWALYPGADAIMSMLFLDSAVVNVDLVAIQVGHKVIYISRGTFGVYVAAGDITLFALLGTFTLQALIAIVTIEGMYTTAVLGLYTLNTLGGYINNVTGAHITNVTGNCTLNVSGAYEAVVEGECAITAVGNMNIDGAAIEVTAAADLNLTSGGDITISASSITLSAANIAIAADSVEVVAGMAFTVESATVTVTGTIVSLFGA